MRFLISICLLVFPLGAMAADDNCVGCNELRKMVRDLRTVAPQPLNPKTIDKQTAMVDKAGDLLIAAFKPKAGAKFNDSINKATAREILLLMVTVTPYDNSISIPPVIIPHFRHHYGKADGPFKQAMDELTSSGAVSEVQKSAMLDAYGFPASP